MRTRIQISTTYINADGHGGLPVIRCGKPRWRIVGRSCKIDQSGELWAQVRGPASEYKVENNQRRQLTLASGLQAHAHKLMHTQRKMHTQKMASFLQPTCQSNNLGMLLYVYINIYMFKVCFLSTTLHVLLGDLLLSFTSITCVSFPINI